MLQSVISEDKLSTRLSPTKSHWSKAFGATQHRTEATSKAQREMLINYTGAVLRYFRAVVRNEHTALDLAQDFAVRFLRGDFRAIDPEREQIPAYLMRTLSNMVNDHFRRQKAEQNRVRAAARNEMYYDEPIEAYAYNHDWVPEILRRTWEALEQRQSEHNNVYYIVLRAHSESPELNSRQLCEVLSAALPLHPVNEAWVRQNLSRARKVFTTLLRAEVAATLQDGRPQSVDEELVALGLLKYCQ